MVDSCETGCSPSSLSVTYLLPWSSLGEPLICILLYVKCLEKEGAEPPSKPVVSTKVSIAMCGYKEILLVTPFLSPQKQWPSFHALPFCFLSLLPDTLLSELLDSLVFYIKIMKLGSNQRTIALSSSL